MLFINHTGPPVIVRLDMTGDAVLRGSDYVAVEGEMVVMNCSLLADPQPTVTWFHNGVLINTGSNPEKYLVPPIGRYVETLVVQTVAPIDSGNYTCRAQNIHTDLQQPTEDTQSLIVLIRLVNLCNHNIAVP